MQISNKETLNNNIKESNDVEISIVTPVYKAEQILEELFNRLKNSLEKITPNFEVIMVHDAGPDNSWEVILRLCKLDPRFKGINFSRNFGQHYAIAAGLDFANGNWIVVMDCDLQDQPEEIEKLYNKALEGYDVVLARRYKRNDNLFKKSTSQAFIALFNYLSESRTDSTVANFGILHKKVVSKYRDMKEHCRIHPQFINWLGFRTTSVNIEHSARYAGKSSYSLKKLLKFATDYIVAFSNKPLRISIKIGFLLVFASIVYIIHLLIKYYTHGIPVEGWTSVIISIWLVGGILLTNLGIIGLYIGKIFEETKNRPLYIIKDVVGDL